MLNEHLRRAEQQVAEDAARIAQQRTLVAELARAGYSTAQARVLLAQFEECRRCTWPRGTGCGGSTIDFSRAGDPEAEGEAPGGGQNGPPSSLRCWKANCASGKSNYAVRTIVHTALENCIFPISRF